ncbi:biopolymer transport protein TolR [Allopseudospirillum japonicum]|uniref:Tol-Pal system protein TolR n=1 Tax=Allopseudospirillum japonicum TaxID=64971 RepID=A0A1H6QAZ3_9GAMM|nr:protein TolR [Allopseudospirillum japonicum]SEI37984.1 biopolymer transport protein TolR [Allopseudospirillum japonicum]
MASSTWRRRPKRKVMAEINVVPYIDVMLVLLIIFMVTAPILTQGVEVELPQATAEALSQEEQQEPLVVAIDQQGSYYLEMGLDARQAVTLEQISEQVARVLAANPSLQVLVRGDRRVAYGQVVELMAHLQAAGAAQVGLISQPPEQ